MTEDRSIDDFLGGESDGDEGSDGENESDGAKTAETVDPAVGTYRWDPEGVACAACGETVNRLWLDDGEQVCEACKEW